VDLASFEIAEVVVHDVPVASSDEPLRLTEGAVDLDEELRQYFRTKVVKSLTTRGLDVVADPTADATVQVEVHQVIGGQAGLVPASQAIARRLYTVQTGANSPGLLAVGTGSLDGSSCVAILKLERERGVRAHFEIVEGRAMIDLEFLRDLTLTEKTRVFKAAALVSDGREPMSMGGLVSDDQRGRDPTVGVANFFLARFLGCKLHADPARMTQLFFDTTVSYLNESVSDPETRARYQIALLASMQEQAPDIRPGTFAEQHLEADHRTGLLDRLEQAGVPAQTSFEKDIERVRRSIAGFRIVFDSGMTLVGKQEDLEERVDVRSEENDQPGADIRDSIKAIRGR
jgi:hypothetical protein